MTEKSNKKPIRKNGLYHARYNSKTQTANEYITNIKLQYFTIFFQSLLMQAKYNNKTTNKVNIYVKPFPIKPNIWLIVILSNFKLLHTWLAV